MKNIETIGSISYVVLLGTIHVAISVKAQLDDLIKTFPTLGRHSRVTAFEETMN